MRIVAGSLKGRRLKLACRSEVRPTSERVRESIFSIIGNYVIGTEAIDLFAGTGALGIEALSRGAKSVTFVEKDRELTKNLYSFCSSCGLLSRTAILNMDVVEAIKLLRRRDSKFDMIFLDPPYNSDWIYNLLCKNVLVDLVAPEAFIVVETAKSYKMKQNPKFENVFSRIYGSSLVQIFKFSKAGARFNMESN